MQQLIQWNFADGEFEEKSILLFVELNKFPLITVFTELNSGKVYSSPIKLQVGTHCLFSHTLHILDPRHA
jgi:hypothetical protein